MTDIRKKIAGKKTRLAQSRVKQDDHPATLNEYQKGSYYLIDVGLILPDPAQPEKQSDPDALHELADSIKQNGLYKPVVVRKDDAEQIILVAGKSRLRAAKMAGFEKIPAIFTQGDPLEISMIENLQSEALKPIEEAEALDRMIEQYGYTREKLAVAIGQAQSAVSDALLLNRLPEAIKKECRQHDKYPRQLLVEIASQDTEEVMMGLFNRAKQDSVQVADAKIVSAGQAERAAPVQAARVVEIAKGDTEEAMMGLSNRAKQVPLKGADAGIVAKEQAERKAPIPAERGTDRGESFNAVLPKSDSEPVGQGKENQLIMELQRLIELIDEQIK